MEHFSGNAAASKRKQPHLEPSSKPRKRRRSVQDIEMENGYTQDTLPEVVDSAEDDDDAVTVGKMNLAVEDKAWQATIENTVDNVVSIHFCHTAAFDSDEAFASQATGFVVDAERGLIMTNRHVVCPGPFWGYCIFNNHEECDVLPVYRDPVHDFGILRFDPKAIKYLKLKHFDLRPDLAKVGVEIRVLGNDAGEKLSILSGVISRLDRNAPEYGEGYNDFNTNYIQAAAAATGGSSGSPVINLDGYAIAIQAGGRSDGAATDFFLPLDRPLRALDCIRQNKPVERGTMQCQFLIKAFDECRRLGLAPEWEASVRKQLPKETGMLVADIILPEGPSHQKLEEGDVLIQVNGELLTQFARLDAILDSHVGKDIEVLVQRGGSDVNVKISVGDLHAITPDRFVSVSGASFHALSYQQARCYGVACKGVFVSDSGGSFKFDSASSGWIITSVDTHDTPDLSTFIEVMKDIPDRSRVVVTYKHLRDLHTHHTSILQVDRHWTRKMRLAVRNDETGFWDFTDIADALPPITPTPKRASFIRMDGVKYPAAAEMIRSFVRVSATFPLKLDGFPKTRKVGFGLVVDADKGLVVVSRVVIPYDACDVSVTIADSIIVQGEVVFMHPLQNYAVIKYNPELVEAPVKSAKLSEKHLSQGEETIFFAYNHNLRPVVAKTSVTDITTVAIPASASAPRWRAVNIEAITIDSGLSSQCGSGVLVSEDGTVQALWLTYLGERNSHGRDVEYHLGLATPTLLPVIRQIQQDVVPDLRIMNAEMSTTQMSQARIMGLSEDWIQRVETEDPNRHQLFMVRKVDSDHPTVRHEGNKFEEGDILLTLNRQLVTRVRHLDIMYNHERLEAVVLRKRQEITLSIPTVPTQELQTTRVVIFAGAILQPPHHAVRQQISKTHSDIYISGRARGSPALLYGLAPTNFIVGVNGTPVNTLDEFLTETNKIPDNTYFRLRSMSFDDVPFVATMKKCEHYFPTMDLRREGEGKWERYIVEKGKTRRESSVPFEPFEIGVDIGDGVE